MSRNPALRLEDVIEACERLQTYMQGISHAVFMDDYKTQDAVIRMFEIIGEAVKALPGDWKDTEPEIPWRQIAGFRDVLAHAYFAIDASVVWTAATERAPQLLQACLRIQSRYQQL
jgi:uncharacterized protein with HEPN domain